MKPSVALRTLITLGALCSAACAHAADDASLAVVRSYEALGLLCFLGGCAFVWKRRNPLYWGIYLGGSVGAAVFEWIYDTRFYFRLTASEHFVPAWTIDGVDAPLAMIFFYAFLWGVPLTLLLDRHDTVVKALGGAARLYAALIAFSMTTTPIFEIVNVSVTRIYTYHQREEFLFHGMPWSQFWFAPLLIVASYWGMVKARALAAEQDAVTRFALGFAAVITGFFVASTLNGVWYALAEPWAATSRPF